MTPNNAGESEPGNGNIYTFTDNKYRRYESHALRDSGTYTITKSAGPENGEPMDAIVFNVTDTVIFTISNDTLILNPRAPMYDGIASRYIRIDGK